MKDLAAERPNGPKIAIVGAGIAGLAAALRLSHAGCQVTVVETQATPGGKMRTTPSVAGPVDAGPTVLTMRWVFDRLFADVGERLDDHLTLTPLQTLARHYWQDGTRFDLMADPQQTQANLTATFGTRAAQDYRRFSARAARLFDAFDAPMMQAAQPSQAALTARVLRQPRLIHDMAPHKSLMQLCRASFAEPRLAQLFARYATYVGGSPFSAPALLSLISHSEARGVWSIAGGMHQLAQTLASLAQARGATFQYSTHAQHIELHAGRVRGLSTSRGDILADAVLFNGDPRALTTGNLGPELSNAIPHLTTEPRSLSAWVHTFAAKPKGPDLAYHTVFFGSSPEAEFDPLAQGKTPKDATLYICAQDRANSTPTGPERFEIILNGPPTDRPETPQEIAQCQTQVFNRLKTFGLSFSPMPDPSSLTTPHMFHQKFPASLGSLYGRSPHGMTAGLKRPTARTTIPGLYLCGGGTHPGAGVPMATLSAQHAAAAIVADQTSTSRSPKMATHGGISTA